MFDSTNPGFQNRRVFIDATAPQVKLPTLTIETYIRAKDANRPHMMAAAFAEDAALVMDVRTDAIAFPACSTGLPAITDVLVRRFGQTYENVYTFYLAEPATSDGNEFSCNWLVAMSEKAGGNVRVGCGTYRFRIDRDTGLMKELTIAIHQMMILPPRTLPQVMDWLAALAYPRCTLTELMATWPPIEALQPVLDWLQSTAVK